MKNQRELSRLSNRIALEGNRVCAIWTRVCREYTGDYTAEIQKRSCLEYAKKKGFEVEVIIEHVGASPKKAEEVCQEVLAFVEEYKVNTLLVCSYDRLTRSFEVFWDIEDYLLSKGIVIISVTSSNEIE